MSRVVGRSWKAYMGRTRWSRGMIAFCLIMAVFDFAVGSWGFGFLMLAFGVVNWVQSNPEKSDSSTDWSWWEWGFGLFSAVLVGGLALFLLYQTSMPDWAKTMASGALVAFVIIGFGIFTYISHKLTRTMYRLSMTLVIMDQFPMELPPYSLRSSLTPSQVVDQAREVAEAAREAEYERWEKVKGIRRSRKVALAKVGIRPSEANNPEVKALSMEDLAVFNALKNELTSLAPDGDGGL